LTLISAFQFGEVVVEWSTQKYAVRFNAFHDNLLGNSYQNRLCLPLPIDIVYTWVNGSDPKLLADLEKLKLEMELEQNRTTLKEIARLRSETNATDEEIAKLISEKASNSKKEKKGKGAVEKNGDKIGDKIGDSRCPFENCVPAFSVVVEDGLLGDLQLSQLREIDFSFGKATRCFNVTTPDTSKEHVSVIQFPGKSETDDALKVKIRWQDKSYRSKEGYYTSDASRPTAVRSGTEIMITNLKAANEVEKVKKDLKDRFGSKLKNVIFHADKLVVVAYFSDKVSASSALKLSLTLNGKSLNLAPAFFIWASFFVKQRTEDDKKEDADISKSFCRQ